MGLMEVITTLVQNRTVHYSDTTTYMQLLNEYSQANSGSSGLRPRMTHAMVRVLQSRIESFSTRLKNNESDERDFSTPVGSAGSRNDIPFDSMNSGTILLEFRF